MSKRAHQDDDSRPPKRPRQSVPPPKPAPPEEIHSANHISTLLTFHPDDLYNFRHGVASFKAFLENILYRKNEDDRGRQLSILKEYLEKEKPAEPTSAEHPFLGGLWQAWSFGSHNNNEQLVSSVSALFALLVKTLSSLLEFRDFGLLLCRTVLQTQHLRLIKRSLEAPRQKDYLLSPVLRLLAELMGFDGGVCARGVWKRREWCCEGVVVRRLLGWGGKAGVTDEEAKRRPAIRTLTLRYLLTLIKYLHEGGKTELLKNRPLCNSLFHFLQDDPQDVVIEILNATEQYILKDDELPRSAKAALLDERNLERVTDIATRSEDHPAAGRAFAWLQALCTKPAYGILRTSGWYPPGTAEASDSKRRKGAIDLGLDSLDFYDRSDKPVIRNTILLSWIQKLRPHSNLQERELVLTCFKSAPELIAAYFAEKIMQLDPKLSNTWIGYASFMFEIVRLPVPAYLGNGDTFAQLPPQTYIMLDNILPRPLTQRVLTRCLNQNSELISFFAVRILILALQKLADVRTQLAEGAQAAAKKADLWREASDRLTASFIERFPSMRDIIATFRKMAEDEEHALQQEGVTRLLRFVYEFLPLQAMEEAFDVSGPLTAALVDAEDGKDESELRQLKLLRLQHLLQIARHSPGMKWLSKQGSLKFSPIVTLLNMHAKDVLNSEVRGLIHHVLLENQIMASIEACDALVAVLKHTNGFQPEVGQFLDDCFVRVTRKPVKYVDDLDALVPIQDDENMQAARSSPLSLLVAVLIEQAPFVASKDEQERAAISEVILGFFDFLGCTQEASTTLRAARSKIANVGGLEHDLQIDDPQRALDQVRFHHIPANDANGSAGEAAEEPKLPFEPPPTESENHPELLRWSQQDLDTALESGTIASLFHCLSSQYPEIRTQVLTQLYKLESALLISTLEDRDPIYILTGELIETYERHCKANGTAMPYLVTCFATHSLDVQRQPLHFMYPKVNAYLNKGPDWRINKLLTYWLDNTILSQPEEDDAFWKEVLWVLEWMVDGLRTVADAEMLRKQGVWEKVMALYASPGAGRHMRERVLELVWRVTFIEGGSDTLITRTGVLSWLEIVGKKDNKTGSESLLRKRVLERCDRGRVEEWVGVGKVK